MEKNGAAAPRPGGRDYLVPLTRAAVMLSRRVDTLEEWAAQGLMPAVELVAGRKSTYASWLHALMRSPRPGGVVGNMAEVTAAWWAEFGETPGAPPAPAPGEVTR